VSEFRLSPEAVNDLELIWTYIAQDNRQAADDVIQAAYRLCVILGVPNWAGSGSSLQPRLQGCGLL
jgi:plasmid stabilization system protein ParE